MPKRYGITSNPRRREAELSREYHGFKNFRVVMEFPNKDVAQDWERGKPNAHSGGRNADGPYYGYYHSYSRKK